MTGVEVVENLISGAADITIAAISEHPKVRKWMQVGLSPHQAQCSHFMLP
jgi:hypothetical protein